MKRSLSSLLPLAALAVFVAGCGSDSKSSSAEANGGAAGASSSNGGATGSTGGTEGADAGVPCGAKFCSPPAGVQAKMCCKDAFAGTCGYKNGNECTDKAPPPPSKCPGVNAMGFTLNGCCVTLTNQCGLDTSAFGGGCVDNATVAAQAKLFVKDAGANITFPAPQACPQ
jgi:hypothetical protein